MLGVVLRKSAVDVWDGMMPIFLGNLLWLGLLLGLVTLVEAAAGRPGLVLPAVLAAAALLALATAAFALALSGWVARRRIDPAELRHGILRIALPVAAAAVPIAAVEVALLVAVLDGWRAGSPVSVALATLLAALGLGLAVYAAYLVPAAGAARSPWRGAGLLLLDNGGFALGILLLALALAALTGGLLPGVGGALVLLRNAAVLRLRRYETPGPPDWTALLAPEITALQRRPWRSLVLPWRF